MIALQVLNKVIQTSDISLLHKNSLTAEYFIGYEDEYNFIAEHYTQYGNVPDKATFIARFPEWDFVQVGEADKYLVDTIREEYLYYKSVPVIQKAAELLKSNANDAASYLLSEVQNLHPSYSIGGEDIISGAMKRYQQYEKRRKNEEPWYITTGFEELDEIVHGWSRGEEFVVLFARTGQGKSWVLGKMLTHAWQVGNRVGYISPEMSPEKIGYRFDTLFKNFSNKNLLWGKDEPEYAAYAAQLAQQQTPFIVATPRDFQKKITVTKLKTFIESNKLDILGVDGITYLTDERKQRGDNKTISLTNISEDLMSLSNELGVPILVVVQSNRGGAKEEGADGTPDLENIRDSDGIAQNATKVLALRQTGAGLEFGIKKHRDGVMGGKLVYFWDIDKGVFNYVPGEEDAARPETRKRKVEEVKKSYNDGSDVF